MVQACTQRYRRKFTTSVYYAPMDVREARRGVSHFFFPPRAPHLTPPPTRQSFTRPLNSPGSNATPLQWQMRTNTGTSATTTSTSEGSSASATGAAPAGAPVGGGGGGVHAPEGATTAAHLFQSPTNPIQPLLAPLGGGGVYTPPSHLSHSSLGWGGEGREGSGYPSGGGSTSSLGRPHAPDPTSYAKAVAAKMHQLQMQQHSAGM